MTFDATRTTTQLLDGLAAGDAAAWEHLDARYRPILVGFARSLGLSAEDAAEVAQQTMADFVPEYRGGGYDRARGRLRSWLIGIARNRILAARRRRSSRREVAGEGLAEALPGDAELTRLWQQERRAVVLRQAMDELKRTSRATDTTMQAFELVVFRQLPAQAVAETLGISPHDVYLAKSRLTERLRAIAARLEAAYEEED